MRHLYAWQMIILMTLALAVAAEGYANLPPTVSYVWARQRPGTQVVDVIYDVTDPDGDALTIRLFLSLDGGQSFTVPCSSVTGDVGPEMPPGTGHSVSWNAGRDAPGLAGSNYVIRVVADDGHAPGDFCQIVAGTFIMGSPTSELGRLSNETEHEVTLTHGFYCQSTEVTNQQYMEMAQWAYSHGYVSVTDSTLRDGLDGSTQVLKTLGSGNCEISFSNGVFSCINADHPVKHVTWYGAAAYCDWLSMEQGLPRAYSHSSWQCNGGDPYGASGFRLPTEAEWEYACRAGSTTAFASGPISQVGCSPLDPSLDHIGWYCGNAGGWTHPVARKMANEWGLFDMHGNLWEWTDDWYAASYGGATTDPVGPGYGVDRVVRGGYWNNGAQACRSAFRDYSYPPWGFNYLGFRVVRSAD